MVDKNQAIIDFISNCPAIAENPLFFNFLNAQSDNKQIITQSNDISTNRKYIDGSILKQFTFTLIDFRSIAYQPIPKVEGYVSENVEEMFDVQGILDWVNEQAESEHYPDFGEDCLIDEMITTSNNPNLDGVDTGVNPALAKYSITITISYLDRSKCWNNQKEE